MAKKMERRPLRPLAERAKQIRAKRHARAAERVKATASADAVVAADVHWIPLHLIDVDTSRNTRADSTANEELRESMKARGQLEPVLVRRVGDRFSLVAGYRRYDAARALGWSRVMARVREGTTDAEVLLDNLAENVGREQLAPAELAGAIMNLHRLKLTDTDIGKNVGLSRSAVVNYRAIMSRVDPQILERWKQQPGTISVPWLLRRAQEPAAEQLEQLEQLGASRPAPRSNGRSTEGAAKRGPGRDKITEWLGAARTQARETKGEERTRIEGVIQAFEYVLGDRPEPFTLEG